MARFTQADLNELNETFENDSPWDLLRWTKDVFGERTAALSAMQRAGCVVCHMIGKLKLKIPVLFVDTGVNFPETLETRDRVGREYGLEIISLLPPQSMEEQTKEHGILYLTPEGQKLCCKLRKTEPLLQVKGQFDCLIGSLRQADGGRRGNVPVLSIDSKMNCIRVNPLAKFTDEQLEEYLLENQVIVNPLHSQGYTTISCNRCTTPVLPTEPKRAGRWRHLGSWSAYCEINPTDRDGGLSKWIDLPTDLIDRLLGRKTDFAI
jgi:phosphoadenosine phosphosulfate reductase